MTERLRKTNWDDDEPVEQTGIEHLAYLDDDYWDDYADEPDDDLDVGPFIDATYDEISGAVDPGVRPRMPGAGVPVADDAMLLAVLAAWTRILATAEPPGVWCFAIDDHDTMTEMLLPMAVGGARPDRNRLDEFFVEFREALDDAEGGLSSLVIAIARPDGGDRGGYERLWSTAVTAAAKRHRVRLRAVAALGSRRASLL
ncbi:hypothetical protein OCAE111667_01050 [Occultella aeris]|uniref:Uncharacterized protein n=1 Tax=Occultella aeris TaxID=2761496 RepID=A0A7M4DT08_9MICO|nr:hypothetical protein [Occultella aeris]VZO40602.1 hypothetical protein HALOF300_05310 [Occultella aeris]